MSNPPNPSRAPAWLQSPKARLALILALGCAAFAGATIGVAAAHESAAFNFGAPGKAADADRTIRIVARDVSFDVGSVTVKAGETVRFVVTNQGAADHEFTLGDAATQAAHRKEMLEMAGMDMSQSHHDANALYLKTGETKTLVWKFGKAARIEFGCNVPGHYEAGMKGIIAIQ